MGKKSKYLVTAALPYANNYIHIGHIAGAYLPPDIYVRLKRLNDEELVFICGSDEHGTAIEMAALTENVTPKEIIDRYHYSNKESFEKLNIKFDIYSRTSNEIHHKTAQEFFLNLFDKNLLTQKTEKQLYSEKEKRFLADRFIIGTCPVCGFEEARGDECENCGSNLSPLELINPKSKITGDIPVEKETTLFYFPFGSYQEELSKWIDSKTDWKQNVINYCKGWFKTGLRERAITRDLDWGVKVPLENQNGKVIYVWFEAPIGYISMSKELFIEKGNPDGWKDYWFDKDTKLVHFIGKDNIVFHSIMFPAMLMAHGDYILPYNVPANEFLNFSGAKFSKSKGNGILVKDIVKIFPADVIRYALAVNFPETKDSDFTWDDLQAKNNNELAAILGNFINRTVVFAKSKFDGKIPSAEIKNENDEKILESIKLSASRVNEFIDKFRFRDGITEMMNSVRAANKYFNDSEPWKLIKSDKARCGSVINTCLEICHSIAVLINPLLPDTSKAILEILNKDESDLKWNKIGRRVLKQDTILGENKILFPQIEDSLIIRLNEEYSSKTEKLVETDETNLVSIDDFRKLELKVAKIMDCERVPKSKKLLKLKLKVGDKSKQIVAGISEYYEPEKLLGKLVVIVNNLQPSKLMGIESQGMLLAAKKNGELKIVTVEGDIEEGADVN
ncbi:MAG: Methionine--tRNA ligase [Ignavibacteria bacterium]|nr:Methionine--tRNA ligase [Ignavibacteria bacterium]